MKWNRRATSITLWLAAAYNLLWGAWVVVFPFASFDALNMSRPIYPEFWQCIGMIVGVYGIGYGIAAKAPDRHWPIVLVGLLGKVFGPIGFAQALWTARLPWGFGWHIIFNDIIWWIPFALSLAYARAEHQRQFKGNK